ncbi:hypothetical protein, partial [Streptomyces kasugaensis]|uniref:hypothetical protein n=1 Tax=Streptomyces kasugaensis TaxID=1946 RepID=UPI001A951FE6
TVPKSTGRQPGSNLTRPETPLILRFLFGCLEWQYSLASPHCARKYPAISGNHHQSQAMPSKPK